MIISGEHCPDEIMVRGAQKQNNMFDISEVSSNRNGGTFLD